MDNQIATWRAWQAVSALQPCAVPGYLQHEVPKDYCKYSNEITQTHLENRTVLSGFQIFYICIILTNGTKLCFCSHTAFRCKPHLSKYPQALSYKPAFLTKTGLKTNFGVSMLLCVPAKQQNSTVLSNSHK